MKKRIKNAIKYIIKGIPEYKIETKIASFDNENYLKDRIVLITGGSKGIGLSIAKKIINSGGKVIITSRNQEELNKVQKELGNKCYAIKHDISNIKENDYVLSEATKHFGVIDSLINNAGISLHENNFMDVTEESFDSNMNINLKGTYFMTQSFIKYYEKHNIKNGKIIIMCSETAGQPSFRPYGLSKAALVSFTKWLAQNYILKGIRINAIAPGVTETAMTNHYTKGNKVNLDAIGKRTLNTFEIAEVCAFLLSDASNCISGQVIACNEANVCFENE